MFEARFQSFEDHAERAASTQRVMALRTELARRGLDGFIVPHADRYQNEYLPPSEARLAWLTGFITTLILPLIILLAAHGILQIPLRDSQGVVIFLFFSWVTSSQAILTLYRLRAVGSWKVASYWYWMVLPSA